MQQFQLSDLDENAVFENQRNNLFKIAKDQVIDYTERKKMPLEEIERWLSPVLNYD